MIYDVRALQVRLARLGFAPGPLDGLMGPSTQAALIAFKRSVGLRPRAYVGPITWDALTKEPARSDIPWLAEAILMLGLHEARNRRELVKWFDASVSWLDPRDVPWCGAFVQTCLLKSDPDIEVPDKPLGARNWRHFGEACTPQLGSILIFWRGSRDGWQGHVGFYWGEDASAYHVLGGNQRNAVTCDTRISKDRLLASRCPVGWDQKMIRKHLTKGGTALSTNEA